MNEATDRTAAADRAAAEKGGRRKRRGSRLVMLVLLPIVAVAAGAAVAYLTGLLDGMLGREAPVEGAPPPDPEVPISELRFVDVPQTVATLRPDGDRAVYVRMKVRLAVASEGEVVEIQRLMPVVRDRINVYLSRRTLQDVTGPAAFGRLSADLKQAVQGALGDIRVHRLVVSDLVVQ